jgi:hypothetical protein
VQLSISSVSLCHAKDDKVKACETMGKVSLEGLFSTEKSWNKKTWESVHEFPFSFMTGDCSHVVTDTM